MKSLRCHLTCFSVLFFTSVFVLAAVQVSAFERALQNQVRQGDWINAENTLRRAEQRCTRQQDAKACLAKVAFSRAWTYTKRAKRDPSNRTAYLQRARNDYLTILEQHPNHLATIDNLLLVLEQLGDRQQLERLLKHLRKMEDDSRLIKATLMVADLYSDDGNTERAFGYFWRAFATEPSQRALNGLRATFRQAPDAEKAKHLLTLAQKTANVSRNRQIYALLLNSRKSIEQEQWETGAIGWLALLGKERLITAELIKNELDLRQNPEFLELTRRLQDPYLGLSPREVRIGDLTLVDYRREGWWHQSLPRTWAFTIAAWSQGHNLLVKNDIKGANSIWQAALQFAPPSSSYDRELKGRWAISLELLTDLARIQRLYKSQVDPEGQTFSRIESTLFDSKAQAYRVNDLQAIQRHHTVMGKMYADLGLFSERKTGIRSAEFQLSHAIQTAEKRGVQTQKADPQPQLAKLLADGYSCRLAGQKSDCQAETSKAQQLYMRATEGYLKLDAVQPAARTFREIKVTPQTESKTRQLKSLIDLRGSLTDDYLQKGKEHPDVVRKKIDIANKWQSLGESEKAREINDQIRKVDEPTVDKTKFYEQRERSDQLKKVIQPPEDKTRVYKQLETDKVETRQNLQIKELQPVELERKE